jgi:hypothetical protein
VVAPNATAAASEAAHAIAHRRCGGSNTNASAPAAAVAVVARTRYSTDVALSHRLVASNATDDATIQPEPRHPGASRAPVLFTAAI